MKYDSLYGRIRWRVTEWWLSERHANLRLRLKYRWIYFRRDHFSPYSKLQRGYWRVFKFFYYLFHKKLCNSNEDTKKEAPWEYNPRAHLTGESALFVDSRPEIERLSTPAKERKPLTEIIKKNTPSVP